MTNIIVTLDDNVPECMAGIIRCGSVVAVDDQGNQIKDHDELVDNAEFHTESELITYIATKLGVAESAVSVES